jgi:FkbM family methyltransferase
VPFLHRLLHSLCERGWRLGPVWSALEAAISPPDTCAARIGQHTIRLNLQDHIGRGIYHGKYEPSELEVVARLLNSGDTAVDVGANIGRFTFEMARAVDRSGQVLAIEPIGSLCDGVARASRASENISVKRRAIDLNMTTATLTMPKTGNLGQSNLMDRGREVEQELVPCSRLDELVTESGIGVINLLKIDVEGWEDRVIRSGEALFDAGAVKFMLIEVSPEFAPIDYVDSLIQVRGFSAFAVTSVPTGRMKLRRRTRLTPLPSSSAISHQTNVLFEHDSVDRWSRERRIGMTGT